MKLLPIILAVTMSVQLAACSGEQEKNVAENLNAQDFHEIYKEKGGQMIDVRTNQEVDEGMITGAVQIDFYRKDFWDEISKLDKEKPVFVYCAAGGRSGKTMKEMVDMGFKEVYNLSGGYGSWLSAGYSTTK